MNELTKEQRVALCGAIRTTRYGRKVISLFRDLADSLYETDAGEITQVLESSMDDDLLNVMRDILKGVDGNNKIVTEEAFRTIIDFLKSVKEVNLTVPVIPKKEFVKKVFDWCSTNLNDEILVSFTTNRLMDSGMVMTYNGNYFEYTLENLLNQYFGSHDLSTYLQQKQAENNNGQ